MARRGGSGPTLVTIYSRDIPAQVNGQSGRDRHQVVLSGKFQRAIDRAKRKADIYTAEADIAQWRRVTVSCEGDFAAAAILGGLPITVVFVIAQRWLVSGLTAGGVKQ